MTRRDGSKNPLLWQKTLNLILGIWLVISPFALFLGIAAMWNNLVLGVIVAAFALTNTYSKVSTPIDLSRRHPEGGRYRIIAKLCASNVNRE